MKKQDFDYDLPKQLIAQTPITNRSSSKLMTYNRKNNQIEHHQFKDIIDYLQPGDVLVMNNSKVIPARLFGIKEDTGAHVEILILKIDEDSVECLVGNAKVVKQGTVITFGEGQLKAECIKTGKEGIRYFKLIYEGILMEILDELGEMPLPPYIHEKLSDKSRYQTVYAQIEGSAAAPTAGLHFTPELLHRIKEKGITCVEVTLHVGLGTFRPLMVDELADVTMHEETYFLSEESAKILNLAKQEGRRIISVGTTTTRVLETQMKVFQKFKAHHGNTDIFISPGFKFEAIDALITNFHLPQSTLLMLVSAFTSREQILNLYELAIMNEYRFFSFGDAMLIY